MSCECKVGEHEPRLLVLTGGPGAGKSAVLESVRRYVCVHVQILPEAASGEERRAAVVLCDRRALDRLVDWPLHAALLQIGSSEPEELARDAPVPGVDT